MGKSDGGRHYESSPNGGRDPQRDRDHPRNKRREGDLDRREGDLDRREGDLDRRDRRDHERYREDRDPRHDRRNRERDYPERMRDTTSYSDSTGQQETYTPASMPPAEMDRYEPQPRETLYTLKYLLTARGLCQLMDFFVNMLIVICAGVTHQASGIYLDLASLGGLYSYYYGGANAFTGADADRVKELDAQFYRLKLPPYVFSMACGGALMAYCLALLLLGIFRVTFRWPVVLLAEAVVDGLISLGYIPALAFYFIKIQENYDTAICKEREALYKSKGHQGFECQLHGADIAGGLFGVLGIISFCFSAVLAIRAFKAVRERKKRKAQQGLS